MNFQTLGKVEEYQKYLDIAFNAGKKRADIGRGIRANDRISKSKRIEEERITTIKDTLKTHLMNILKSFPSIDDLPPFYVELIKITIDYPNLKKSLGAVNWAVKKTDFFYKEYYDKIKKTEVMPKVNEYRRGFIGRISSVLKQIKKELIFLEECRRIMKGFPSIKTKLKTVCIFGFPNVGKSTLLSKITTSTPEIKNYAFTTKRLNVGYLSTEKGRIQFIDTPGTLNRFEKMNPIEKQAYLALKHCCDLVVYIFDLTESYPVEDQMKLYKNLKKMYPEMPIVVVFSKADLLSDDKIEKFNIKGISNRDVLIEHLLKKLS